MLTEHKAVDAALLAGAGNPELQSMVRIVGSLRIRVEPVPKAV